MINYFLERLKGIEIYKAWFIIIFVSLGGVLYGYDLGVISGALLFVRKEIQLSSQQISFIVAAVLGGGAIATLCSGLLADWFGRKKMIVAATIIFAIGILTAVFAHIYIGILLGRLIQGVGVGIISIVVPLYLAEIAPPKLRGRGLAMFQLFLTGGILIAYLVNVLFATSENWRGMFLCALIPNFLLFFGSFILPESPSWLFVRGKKGKAFKALLYVQSKYDAECKMEEMKRNYGELMESRTKEKVWQHYVFLPMLLSLVVACLNQLTGINVILQYSSCLFESAGLKSNFSAMVGSVGVGLTVFVVTLFALSLVDRIGRKYLLMIGTGGVTVALFVLGAIEFFMHTSNFKGYVLIAGLIMYVSFYSIGPGIVVWLALSEILPLRIRGKWMAFCLFVNAMTSTILASCFVRLIELVNYSGTFWIFAVFTSCYFLVATLFFPETKNKSLEDIERYWHRCKNFTEC